MPAPFGEYTTVQIRESLGFRHLHGGALERARGADVLADPRIAANKGDKSVEIIMNEILTRLCLRPTMHADCAARAFPAKENRAI